MAGASEEIGIHWYVWRTSQDARVRPSHANLDGVLCNWGDPPAPEELIGGESDGRYNAGEGVGCRCLPEPVVNHDSLEWPCRVHLEGEIFRMTKRQFEKIK